MKKITLLITLLTISLGFGQTNLITNGDFETGVVDPWVKISGNNAFNTSTNTPYEGLRRANMGNESMAIGQDITPALNVEYTVTFWWRWNRNDSTNPAYASIRSNVDNSSIATLDLPSGVNSGQTGVADASSYQKATFTFTSTSETNLRFQIDKPNRSNDPGTNTDGFSTNNAIWFDLVSIVPTSSLAVDDLTKFNFSSYPNPATDMIYFSASKNIDKIEIYNLVGQRVESRILNNNQVNVSKLSKGIYIMKAFIGNAVGTYKFVKE